MRQMRQKALAFKAISALVAALWLMVAVVGACPQLHHALHEDSTAPDHSCVVERVTNGSFLFSPAQPVVVAIRPVLAGRFESDPIILPARDFRVALSRGPPSLLTSRTVAG
ncbi:MAG TPA: hypothetical protein VK850_16090 [Candidatus Binatia bacterium]|nr:hypothetical protein [Candidatus Binatia bacterium]